jgi:hypothetical protein
MRAAKIFMDATSNLTGSATKIQNQQNNFIHIKWSNSYRAANTKIADRKTKPG